MSMYVSFDGGEGAFLSSNSGYWDFARWVESKDLGDDSPSRHLIDHGWYEPAEDLREELRGIFEKSPPSEDDIIETVKDLLSLLGNETDSVVTIHQGTVSSARS